MYVGADDIHARVTEALIKTNKNILHKDVLDSLGWLYCPSDPGSLFGYYSDKDNQARIVAVPVGSDGYCHMDEMCDVERADIPSFEENCDGYEEICKAFMEMQAIMSMPL